jgi:hypothetical protein
LTDRVLVAVFLLALALTGLSGFSHVSRCGGVLAVVPAPPADWQDWAVEAQGSHQRKLGGFTIRGATIDYKGYPASITDAELGDPSLCFASTVSLRSWFDRDMYRAAPDLTLRKAPSGATFAVSGRLFGGEYELITAFRRDPTPRVAFDRRDSYFFTLLSVALLCLGSLRFGLTRAREKRADPTSLPAAPSGRRLTFGLFLAAALLPLALGARFYLSSEPRPGREFYVRHVSP